MALVIVVMTGLAYYHVISLVTDKSLEQLEKYIVERGEREREIFRLAADNHALLKREVLDRLDRLGDADPRVDFDRLHERFPDGTTRTRLEGFDGTRQAFTFIGRSVAIDADIRRRVMTFLDLANQFGPAWHHRLENVYFTMPENILVGYWPEVPDWAHNASPDLHMPAEEYVWAADMEHNPSRRTVWTGLFYDAAGRTWMVSAETPVDMDGRQVATIGHDITLNQLFQRTIDDRLEGAYNIILRADGRLIAHPERMEAIKAAQGYFDIAESGDEHLKRIYQLVRSRDPAARIIENSVDEEYLAVSTIDEAGWYFVVAYPKHLVADVALGTASIILLLGFVSLLIEVLVLYLVLRSDVAGPLKALVQATDRVAAGDFDVQLDTRRTDELGHVARSFNTMSAGIAKRTTALAESEERLANAQRIAHLGNWEWNIVTDELYWSTETYRIFGVPPRSFAEPFTGFMEYVHPQDRDRFRTNVRETLASRAPYDIVHRVVRQDGEVRTVHQLGETTYGDDGRPIRMTGTIQDITEARRMELALRESEARFRATFEQAAVGVAHVGLDGRWMRVNQRLCDIVGYTREDLLKRTFQDITHPHDLEADLGYARRLLAGEIPDYSMEKRYFRSDGSVVWINLTGTLVRRLSGEPDYFIAVVEDISERKRAEEQIRTLNAELEQRVEARTADLRKSEEQYRAVVEDQTELICRHLPGGELTFVNEAYCRYFGKRRDELIGRAFMPFIPEEDRDGVRACLASLGSGTPVLEHEHRVVAPSGEVRWQRWVNRVILDGRGHVVEFQGVGRDITEQKRLEDQLLRKERLAGLGQLTATVAHELRNPLGAIAASVAVIRRVCAGTAVELDGVLERTDRSIGRCDRIITELLDFARAKGLRLQDMSLDAWLSGLIEEQHLPDRVTLTFTPQTNGALVGFDPEELRRAVINVIDNACQAMTEDSRGTGAAPGGELTIVTRTRNGRIEIEVADTGPGIPEDVLPQVLEPLFSTKAFGTGLGLPTVQRIMDEHGGGLEIGSERGLGTRVVLWLPIRLQEGRAA